MSSNWRPRLQRLGRRFAARLQLSAAERAERGVGAVLVYHGVGNVGPADVSGVMPVLDATTFAEQLRHLRQHYQVVPLRAMEAAMNRAEGSRIPIALTF